VRFGIPIGKRGAGGKKVRLAPSEGSWVSKKESFHHWRGAHARAQNIPREQRLPKGRCKSKVPVKEKGGIPGSVTGGSLKGSSAAGNHNKGTIAPPSGVRPRSRGSGPLKTHQAVELRFATKKRGFASKKVILPSRIPTQNGDRRVSRKSVEKIKISRRHRSVGPRS